MQLVKIVTIDKKKNKVIVWCTTNEEKSFFDFMQYILDSLSKLEDFLIWDVKADQVYSMYGIATKQFGMRKRTFEERMNGVQTYRKAGA
jgi:hypothetical protein